MNSQNVVKINVDVILKEEDAKFFNFICELSKKEHDFKSPKEFIEFLFMTGFTFVRGQFVGSMMADMMNKEPPAYATFLGKMQPMVAMKITPIESKEKENYIDFDRAFLNGEPAEYKVADDKQTLSLRISNKKNKGKWTDVYLLKNNIPLTWKGVAV